jgi:hypothetical protein
LKVQNQKVQNQKVQSQKVQSQYAVCPLDRRQQGAEASCSHDYWCLVSASRYFSAFSAGVGHPLKALDERGSQISDHAVAAVSILQDLARLI